MRFNIFALVACAVSAVALTISAPEQDDKVDLSKPYEIKWRNVDSDPTTFNIKLVNMNGGSNSTNVHKEVAKDIKVSQGSYTIKPVWGIEKGKEYQFNFVREDKKNTGILAQSQHFEVTNVADPPKSASPSSSSTSASSTPTESSAASPAFAAPVAGSLLMTLFAFAL